MRPIALAATIVAVGVGAAPAPAAAAFPHATFTVTLAGKSPRFLNGAWRITFLESGRYTTEHPLNEIAARGRIALSGGTVTFGRETGSVACATAGRYRWSYRDNRLRFTAISDACGGRQIVLTAKPLRLVAG
jgi:hypothetical protein